MRKLVLMPNKAPIPVERKPAWKYLEKKNFKEQNLIHCWTVMNRGKQGQGLIDGHYLDYVVEDVLSSGFIFQASVP